MLCGEKGGEKENDKCDKGGKGKWGNEKHHEKIKQCAQQTMDLKACCPFPENEALKDDPDCKHHLEGIDKKNEKDQHKAYKCFSECIFTERDMFVNGSFVDSEIHDFNDEFLADFGGEDFLHITGSSIDYCLAECKL